MAWLPPYSPHISTRLLVFLHRRTTSLVRFLHSSHLRSFICLSPFFSTRRLVYYTIQFVISRLGTQAAYTHLRQKKTQQLSSISFASTFACIDFIRLLFASQPFHSHSVLSTRFIMSIFLVLLLLLFFFSYSFLCRFSCSLSVSSSLKFLYIILCSYCCCLVVFAVVVHSTS